MKNIDEYKNKIKKLKKIQQIPTLIMTISIMIIIYSFSNVTKLSTLGIICLFIAIISGGITHGIGKQIEELENKIETMDTITKSIEDSKN